jgi:hypothetical protein
MSIKGLVLFLFDVGAMLLMPSGLICVVNSEKIGV